MQLPRIFTAIRDTFKDTFSKQGVLDWWYRIGHHLADPWPATAYVIQRRWGGAFLIKSRARRIVETDGNQSYIFRDGTLAGKKMNAPELRHFFYDWEGKPSFFAGSPTPKEFYVIELDQSLKELNPQITEEALAFVNNELRRASVKYQKDKQWWERVLPYVLPIIFVIFVYLAYTHMSQTLLDLAKAWAGEVRPATNTLISGIDRLTQVAGKI